MNYVEYFKTKQGFIRFFAKARDKYQKYGKVVGKIHMDNLSEEEAKALTSFFARKFVAQNSYDISINEFMKKVQRGRFDDFDFSYYFSQVYEDFTFETNREKRIKKVEAFHSFLEESITQMRCEKLKAFLKDNMNRSNQTMTLIRRKYTKDKKECRKELLDIDTLLRHIPNEVTYLPIYASLISNPHYLDFSSSTGSLFYRILSYILEEDTPKTNEDKAKLLESINVYTDPLSNFVIVHNLVYSVSVPFQTMNLNIENISSLDKIRGKKNKIFIFENPSILNRFKSLNIDASVVITSGIPNLAFYKLLEKIDRETLLYYNGDFDPEGLLIAEKVKSRFPKVVFFGYSKENYILTKPIQEISAKRLHKLEHVHSFELEEIKQCLLEQKKAGYQENQLEFIEDYVQDKLNV